MKTYILSAPNQLHGEDGSFWDADAALSTTLWGGDIATTQHGQEQRGLV